MTYPQDPNNPYGQQPGYGQQYPSGGYPQFPPQPPYPGMAGPGLAIGGLVCSILGTFLCLFVGIAGIIMGHIALGKAKRGEAEGQGIALAAVIIGYVGIALNIAFVALGIALGVIGSWR
ncbi:DUF4190 domain-containing protein [Amycolatopsis sp. NEAU-NG30]|uniref:DUF4190 domain-containing protein n=1 Tax=Amycolatopsis melonis TaxID=3156488 RepID=A0ABV0LN94_9PSEU